MMRRTLRFLVLLCSSALPVASVADGLTVYNIQGALESGGTASGTISVYSGTGQITQVNIVLADFGSTFQFGGFVGEGTGAGLSEVFSDGKQGGEPDYLTLAFPQSTLAGYAGGSLCSIDFLCSDPKLPLTGDRSSLQINIGYADDPKFRSTTDYFTSLSASVQSVPEPGTLGLVGTGLAGVLGAGIRRLRLSARCVEGIPESLIETHS